MSDEACTADVSLLQLCGSEKREFSASTSLRKALQVQVHVDERRTKDSESDFRHMCHVLHRTLARAGAPRIPCTCMVAHSYDRTHLYTIVAKIGRRTQDLGSCVADFRITIVNIRTNGWNDEK